jgi:hypothetical protein
MPSDTPLLGVVIIITTLSSDDAARRPLLEEDGEALRVFPTFLSLMTFG